MSRTVTAPTTPLLETPLVAEHRALGARLVPFAGWLMPVQYEGIRQEHEAVRQRAGLFDVSHMGQLRVRARDGSTDTLHRALEAALPVDFDGWAPGLQKDRKSVV